MITSEPYQSESPYLVREHAPVHDELVANNLRVLEGEIPRDLNGMFVRNSGNPRHKPPGRYHWFDGDGMVHGIRLDNGSASYVNRWIRTKAFNVEHEAGKAVWGGLYDPLDMTNPHGPIKDTANTDLIVHNGKLLSLWWLSGKPYELSVPSLETVGPCDFDGTLGKRQNVAAHAKVDPITGEMMFFDFNIIRRPFYHYGVIGADGRVAHYTAIDTPSPHVPHDIGITPNYTIILDLALGWDPVALAKGKRRIGFNREVPARFGVIPRFGTNEDVRWFEHDPCYIYHTIRAFEDGDDVVLTACRIQNPCPGEQDPTGTRARLDHIELVPSMYEWRFNMATGETKGRTIDSVATEFPRINDQRWTQQARYSYNPRIAPRSELLFDGLIRYDLVEDRQVSVDLDPGWYAGEFVFAPRAGATREDDGWVVSALTHAGKDASRFAILRADAIDDGPVAVIELPRRIPCGFHADWVPA